MEGKEQNLISIIIIAVFLLAPLVMKMLGKKFNVKQDNPAHEKTDDGTRQMPLEIPRLPDVMHEPDRMQQAGTEISSNKPIKPKWF